MWLFPPTSRYSFSLDDDHKLRNTRKLKRKCRKAAKTTKKVKRQLNIDIENVRMGRSSGESDMNDDDADDHMMLQPPPGKSIFPVYLM